MRRIVVSVIVVVAAALCPVDAQRIVEYNARQMLDLYERDRPAAVAALGDHLHLDSIWDEIRGRGEQWIAAKGKGEMNRRRLVLATFILEVVDRQDRSEWGRYPPYAMANRLVDWMDDDLAAQRLPLPAERTWRLAVIAEFQRRGNRRFLEAQLNRADQRFPNEPAWLLVRAGLADKDRPPGASPCLRALGSDHVWETCDAPFFSNSEALYKKAMALPAIGAQARIEFALLHLRREHWDSVIRLTTEADALTHDPALRYLSALLRAWAYAGQKDRPNAIAAFRLALEAVPHAQTAAVQLASMLLLDGVREEGAELVTQALTSDVIDPWLAHRDGGYGNWPRLIATLRDELK